MLVLDADDCDVERLARGRDAFAEHAYLRDFASAAGGHEVERRHLVGDHAELRLQQPDERRQRVLHLLRVHGRRFVLLQGERVCLDDPVKALQLCLRLLDRLHFLNTSAVELRRSHAESYFTRSSFGLSRNSRPAFACGFPVRFSTPPGKQHPPPPPPPPTPLHSPPPPPPPPPSHTLPHRTPPAPHPG